MGACAKCQAAQADWRAADPGGYAGGEDEDDDDDGMDADAVVMPVAAVARPPPT